MCACVYVCVCVGGKEKGGGGGKEKVVGRIVGIQSISNGSQSLHYTPHPTFSILLHLSYYTTSAVFRLSDQKILPVAYVFVSILYKQRGKGREGEGKMGENCFRLNCICSYNRQIEAPERFQIET